MSQINLILAIDSEGLNNKTLDEVIEEVHAQLSASGITARVSSPEPLEIDELLDIREEVEAAQDAYGFDAGNVFWCLDELLAALGHEPEPEQ